MAKIGICALVPILLLQVSRRLQHRVLLIYQHPVLETLDGVAVSAVERQAAEMVFGGEEVIHLLGWQFVKCPK